MKNKILGKLEIWFLKWLIGWAEILQGLIDVGSFTLLSPRLALWVAGKYCRRKHHIEEANRD